MVFAGTMKSIVATNINFPYSVTNRFRGALGDVYTRGAYLSGAFAGVTWIISVALTMMILVQASPASLLCFAAIVRVSSQWT